ncbi:MAG TPA: acyl-CoA thioesterase/bile acid-CoA:amino acid N-acyltransferase family protein [Jatrophihabitans sp.]|nr:acyl-CoA thioesterase/bile acid-CoA:amino acid N-acyltransferase family protein [Jatrophihabitans sp.]
MLDRRGRRQWAMLVPAALVLAGLAGCGGSRPSGHAVITVSPATAVLDVPVTVRLTGLPADAGITVAAAATDGRGVVWRSAAVYRSDAAGQLGLDQAPVSGSYTGRNPMGLFQFMKPPASAPLDDVRLFPSAGGLTVRLTASAAGRQLAEAVAVRQPPQAAGVTERRYRPGPDGIYADLYLPAHPAGRHPAVLVFGGSEGGISDDLNAALLASHGYPAMALAYFAEPGLPQALVNIPLEYFAKALTVLRAVPGVDPGHVLVSGASRGGEAALLLGSYFPNLVDGVIAGVPSSVVIPGDVPGSQPAWRLGGRPLPYVSVHDFGNPNPADAQQAVIPVERIRGPLLLDCGILDRVWPSCSYLDAITSRLSAHHFEYPVTPVKLDGGHFVANPLRYYSATDPNFANGGGDASSDEPAQAEVYGKVLDLLASVTRH